MRLCVRGGGARDRSRRRGALGAVVCIESRLSNTADTSFAKAGSNVGLEQTSGPPGTALFAAAPPVGVATEMGLSGLSGKGCVTATCFCANSCSGDCLVSGTEGAKSLGGLAVSPISTERGESLRVSDGGASPDAGRELLRAAMAGDSPSATPRACSKSRTFDAAMGFRGTSSGLRSRIGTYEALKVGLS